MTTNSDLAARILITYEASLNCDGKDTLAQRIEAMTRTVEALHLREKAALDMNLPEWCLPPFTS